MKLNTLAAATAIAAFASLALAQDRAEELADIVRRLDELYRSSGAYARMEMIVETPHWKRTMTMESWSEGLEKTFIRVLSPRKEKGMATLRNGTEMWNYIPKINKVMKVPPSMMMGSWMGSDFTNDDLVKESSFRDDYAAELLDPPEDEPTPPAHHYIQFTPHEQTISVWGRIVAKVTKEGLLPVWQEYYDERGRKMRVMRFAEIRELGKRTIPSVMELVPLNKQGHRTVIRYHEARFDERLGQDVFSLRNLRRKHN